ncbi:MAG TPA: CPBP family intramembrane glutamic endopeptidase [Thermoanaerobaculia bacterium]|nr:CPBP family intramembrane glutamic endopeptidase [Thermoanaerobaculia bacterium]
MARRFLRPLLLFLLFVVVSQLLEALLDWVFLMKLQVIDVRDASWRPSLFIWAEGITTVAALAAAGLVAIAGRRSFASLGFAATRAGRRLCIGSLFGLGAVALLVGAIAALGGYSPGHLMMTGPRLAGTAIAWLVAMFGIGLAEETTFRGAGLITLGEAIGFWPAAIVISAIFAALHYFGKGPIENLADALSVGLLGLFMSFTVLRTGSIWFAVGFHALFDDAALYIFGAPNSGNHQGQPIATRLLSGGFHGPQWLTGGPLGVEASWLVFPVIALLFVVFHLLHRRAEAPGYNPPVPVQSKRGGVV